MTVRRRTGSAADAVLDVVPGVVVEPATLDEAAEVVGASARSGERLMFVGGGTELGIGPPPEGLDVVLRTRRLDRVVEHAPSDQIVTVECGVRLAALQATLAAHGQMLALDPPWAERATVGGLVATGAFGPRRTRYGSVRDLIIGVSFVRADGTRVRGGGKVVKNVAGFDLPKLMTGSHGTLGLIATVTLRLHPRPEASATVLFARVAAADVQRVVAAARDAQLEPDAAAVVVTAGSRDAHLGLRFEGFGDGVSRQCQRLRDAAAGLGLEAAVLDGAAAAAFWAQHEAARGAAAQLRVKLATLPADPASAELTGRLRAALGGGRSVFYPTLGLGFVAGDVGAPEEIVAAIAEVREALAPKGGSLVVHEAPAALRALVEVWGVPPSLRAALPLMQSMKQRLDPGRRLAPGRFVGGI